VTWEAYSVAVKIQLINQATAGLATLTAQFRGAERDAAALQGRLTEIRRLGGLALASGAVGAAGFAGLGIFHKIVKPAEEFTHQLALMNAAGMRQKEIAESIAAAWQTSQKVITSTASDNLKTIREMRQVFGNTGDAIRYLPQMQMLQAVLESTLHGQGGIGAKDVAYTAARALELRGVSMNPKDFLEQADLIARAAIASGGKVTPRDQLLAQKYSGQYGASFSNRFRWGIMPTLVQELGGASTGTALTSLMQALTGGRMTPQAARLLSHLTLHGAPLLDMGKYQAFRSGMPGVTALGALQGTEHGVADPDLWIQNYLMAALKEGGITDPAKQAAVLGQAFSNRTAARAAYLLGTQGARLDKDAGLIGQAKGIGGYYSLIKSDPDMAWKALGAAWENLKTSIGVNVVPIIIPALNKLAADLNDFGAWARRHPDLTKDLVIGFGALSGAMAIGGTLGAITFGFKALGAAIGFGSKVGLVAGLGELAGISGLGGLGLTLGGIAVGLGALVLATGAMAAALNALDKDSDLDPKGHPGKRFHHTGHGGFWETDTSLDQSHAGMHWVPIAHAGGKWVPDLAAKGGGPMVMQGDVHLDGKKVGKVMWSQLSDGLTRGSRATNSTSDPTMILPPISAPASVR